MRLPVELKGGLLLSINTFLILVLAFPVQILIARYLGPEKLGQFAYVLSFWVIARVFVRLNLQDVIIPLTSQPKFKDSKETLYSTGWLLLKITSLVLLTATLIIAFYFQLSSQETNASTTWQIAIVIVATLFSDHQIYSIWCKCEAQLWDFVKVDFLGTMVGLAARVGLVSTGGTINELLASYILEEFAKLCIAGYLYRFGNRVFFRLKTSSLETAKTLLKLSWPIWLSALLTVAYTRFDQILLGHLLPDTSQLGHYSVAARIVEALTAGAVALFIIYLPILSRSEGDVYQHQLQRLHDLAIWGSLLLFCPLYLVLKPLVVLLYGPRYQLAAELSEVYLLGLPALCLSLSRAAFMYTRGYQKLELVLKMVGVGTNICLNLVLIPQFGALGAIWATIGVQWVVSVLINIFLPPLRPVATVTIKALYLPASFPRLCHWMNETKESKTSGANS